MKETEFTLSSDKNSWMDTAVVSDIPYKVTIIDPRDFIVAATRILESLPFVIEGDYSKEAITHLARAMVHSFMSAVVHRRRAWVHGDDVDFYLHINQFRELIGVDIEPHIRDTIRLELSDIRSRHAMLIMDDLIREILTTMQKHMNPNKYVLHELNQTRDLRTFMLEEYADWRVIQWTRQEQAKIDARHEDI